MTTAVDQITVVIYTGMCTSLTCNVSCQRCQLNIKPMHCSINTPHPYSDCQLLQPTASRSYTKTLEQSHRRSFVVPGRFEHCFLVHSTAKFKVFTGRNDRRAQGFLEMHHQRHRHESYKRADESFTFNIPQVGVAGQRHAHQGLKFKRDNENRRPPRSLPSELPSGGPDRSSDL